MEAGDWVIEQGVVKQVPLDACINLLALYGRLSKPWKPQKGELCVFWDDGVYIIDSYVWSKTNNGLKPKRFVAYISDRAYTNIAPLEFVQILKERLR